MLVSKYGKAIRSTWPSLSNPDQVRQVRALDSNSVPPLNLTTLPASRHGLTLRHRADNQPVQINETLAQFG
ncbi:uncharacterized protein METZ01_LOCUS333069 [marine metagenome]|uniref:Uncharacterized protein n=1 Tax=marine metagenome TaxID=408172 RepID=A0A382Q5M1_9ZZZZ